MDFNELYVDTCPSASKLAAVGDTEKLKKLVDLGKPTNGQDNKGWRALHHACNGGHIECIQILLKAGDVDINATTFERETALYLVCRSKLDQDIKIKAAEVLLEAGANPNHENQKQYVTILNQVVSSGDLPLAKLLLKFKVNVNEHDDKYGSTLNAAVQSKSLEMVKLITMQRLEYHFQGYSRKGLTEFLHLAVMQKSTDILDHLTKNPRCSMEINNRNRNGETPLILACMKQYREGIKILLDHCADPNIKDSSDKLPLMYIAENIVDEDLASSESIFGKMVKLTNKREFKRPRSCFRSFLHRLPFYKRSVEIFNYVMEHFPDVNLRGVYAPVDYWVMLPMNHDTHYGEKFTFSPLAYCCDQLEKHKNYDIFRKMVEYDSNINEYSNHRIPPLIVALGSENPDLYIIEHLIRNGASLWLIIEERFGYDYPSPLNCLLQTPDPSPALELIFALVAPPEYLFVYSEAVFHTFLSQTQRLQGDIFLKHREAVPPKSFLKVVCSISKYAWKKFFSESDVEEYTEVLGSNWDQASHCSVSSEDQIEIKQLEEKVSNMFRTPRSLHQLAVLRIRDKLNKHKPTNLVNLYERIEDLVKEMKLPETIKHQLLFK